MVGVKRAVLGQRLQRREAASAGDDGEALGAVVIRAVAARDQVLEQPVRLDGSLELALGGVIGRGLAHVLGREREPAERDLPDGRLGSGSDLVHRGLPWMKGLRRGSARHLVRAHPTRAALSSRCRSPR